MKKLVFLTGQPGIGKTTVLKKIIEGLKQEHFTVGGMVTAEIRGGDKRVGFEITDISTGRRGMLAHCLQGGGPRLGKYKVNLGDIANVGAKAIEQAVQEVDVVVIDEVGPMELFSVEFKRAVEKALNSRKTVVGTIHYRAKDPLINSIKSQQNVDIIEVTFENRSTLHETVMNLIRKP